MGFERTDFTWSGVKDGSLEAECRGGIYSL